MRIHLEDALVRVGHVPVELRGLRPTAVRVRVLGGAPAVAEAGVAEGAGAAAGGPLRRLGASLGLGPGVEHLLEAAPERAPATAPRGGRGLLPVHGVTGCCSQTVPSITELQHQQQPTQSSAIVMPLLCSGLGWAGLGGERARHWFVDAVDSLHASVAASLCSATEQCCVKMTQCCVEITANITEDSQWLCPGAGASSRCAAAALLRSLSSQQGAPQATGRQPPPALYSLYSFTVQCAGRLGPGGDQGWSRLLFPIYGGNQDQDILRPVTDV